MKRMLTQMVMGRYYLPTIKVYSTFLIFSIFCINYLQSQVAGNVFFEVPVSTNSTALNIYGVKDANEFGLAGVNVIVYNNDGTDSGNIMTDVNGDWMYASPVYPVRIEFSWMGRFPFLEESPQTSDSRSSVQFVTATNTNIDLGLHDPNIYCHSNNPLLVIPCYVNEALTIDGGTNGAEDAFVRFNYDSNGDTKADHFYIADHDDIGATWGVAYDKINERIYTSAVAKRHVSFGPQGEAAIYIMDNSNPSAQTLQGYIDLSSTLPTTADPRTAAAWDPVGNRSYDPDMFSLIGKMGFGDIEISPDGNTLWVMNLSNKSLYSIDISSINPSVTPATIGAVTQYSTGLDPGCTNGDFQPWGLKIYQGQVYVGVVCSGETTAMTDINAARSELNAYVMRLDGSSFVTAFGPLDLTYTKDQSGGGTNPYRRQWNAWIDEFSDIIFNAAGDEAGYPQPILTDIEFDIDGSIILGFMDRLGFQLGNANSSTSAADMQLYSGETGGDIIRICNINGTLTLEGTSTCITPINPASGFGINGQEYYAGDELMGNAAHRDRAQGGLTFLAGAGQIVTNALNPLNSNSGGVIWLSNTTGQETQAYEIFAGGNPSFNKAAGLGDMELLCNAAPVEIGNLVWNDANANGIQDPNENGISGVEVELYDPNSMTVIATATTDGSGNYLFSTATGTNSNEFRYNLNLTFGNSYQVRIVNAEGGSQQTPLNSLSVTAQNNDTSTNGDIRDSDGSQANTSVITFSLGNQGQNDHSFDFGFSNMPTDDCDCHEYLYVNDTDLNQVHKFEIDAATGGLTEIDADPNTPTIDPWLIGITNPHGLASDINGYLYIGELFGDVWRINCDGMPISQNFFDTSGKNFAEFENLILTNSEEGLITAWDPCDPTNAVGSIQLVDENGVNAANNWGFYKDAADTYYASGGTETNDLNAIWKFNLTLSDFTAGTTFSPLVGNAGFPTTARMYGVTADAAGNIYIYYTLQSPDFDNVLEKYDANGNFVNRVIGNWNAVGWDRAQGIVYSETADVVYISGGAPAVADCVGYFDPITLNYTGVIPHVPNQDPKGIAINKECCPTITPLVYNETVCSGGNGAKVFLNEVFNCGDGTVCEGVWTVETANVNQTFNPCDLSITVIGDGCGTYVLERSTAPSGAQRCAPFRIEVQVCTEVPMATLIPDDGTCTAMTPNDDASVNISGVQSADEANVSQGATYTGPDYGNGGVDISSGSGIIMGLMHNTPYTVRIFNGSNDCFVDYIVTTPNINCNSPCNLTDAGETQETCNDNNTFSDASDDYITFNLNPVGTDLGATYSVTSDNGGVVSLIGGGAATNVNYNSSTAFRLQDGSANGTTNYTISVTDDTDGSCQVTTMVMQDNCFVCPTITNPTAPQTICDGQSMTMLSTNTDATTDIQFVYFTTQQSGNSMYTGGTMIATVTPNAGVASISNVVFPAAGTYYVYTILSPAPGEVNCRPFQEIPITVAPNPDLTLIMSSTSVCDGQDGMIEVLNSEVGVSYQLRNEADDSPIGSPIAGNGSIITFTVSGLAIGTYNFNVLATNVTTGCNGELDNAGLIQINRCDFPRFPPPICPFPACHIIPISPQVYFGTGVTNDPQSAGNTNNDVNDGVQIPNDIRRNIDIRLPITFYNNTGNTTYIQGWIDWNGDTDYSAPEQIANLTVPFDGANLTQTISLLVSVPADAVQDLPITMRFRISTDPIIIGAACGVVGCAADGEVEDYLIQLECPEEVCLPTGMTIFRGN